MLVTLRSCLFTLQLTSLRHAPQSLSHKTPLFCISHKIKMSETLKVNPYFCNHASFATKGSKPGPVSEATKFIQTVLFVPPGVNPDEVTDDLILPGSNIVLGPYAGDAKIKEVEFVKSSNRPKDCPKDDRPEFAMLGRSNVGKSSLINALVRKKEVALTSKKPALSVYSFANAPEAARMDWSAFTKGYFLNRDTLVSVLLLVDASVPPQKIDLDCANWLGRNNIPMTLVFTKCDKVKGAKARRPDENIRDFQQLIRENYKRHPPWIMTSSVTGVGRNELLLHLSQLRNYWNN